MAILQNFAYVFLLVKPTPSHGMPKLRNFSAPRRLNLYACFSQQGEHA